MNCWGTIFILKQRQGRNVLDPVSFPVAEILVLLLVKGSRIFGFNFFSILEFRFFYYYYFVFLLSQSSLWWNCRWERGPWSETQFLVYQAEVNGQYQSDQGCWAAAYLLMALPRCFVSWERIITVGLDVSWSHLLVLFHFVVIFN